MTTVALLLFNLNENQGITRNLEALAQSVDEIVIVDSSSAEQYEMLLESARQYRAKVYRALPLGFVDPLRPFGVSKVQSEYVLNLDADEEVAEPLRSDLHKLSKADGYVVPRYEAQLRSYTYHLRLFRPSSVHYSGRSFDFPEVRGRLDWLDKSHKITHRVDYEQYFGDKARGERYFTIENIERPFSVRYLKDALTIRIRGRSLSLAPTNFLRGTPDSFLSSRMARGTIELEFMRDIALGKGLRASGFNRRYSLAKLRFFQALPKAEQIHLTAIAQDLQRSGGLFEYLCINDPEYVESLTASFRWRLNGIQVYRALLDYRHGHGKPPDAVPGQ